MQQTQIVTEDSPAVVLVAPRGGPAVLFVAISAVEMDGATTVDLLDFEGIPVATVTDPALQYYVTRPGAGSRSYGLGAFLIGDDPDTDDSALYSLIGVSLTPAAPEWMRSSNWKLGAPQ